MSIDKIKKKHSITKKYKISIQIMRIKFERKKTNERINNFEMKGWIEIKINFTKELKEETARGSNFERKKTN